MNLRKKKQLASKVLRVGKNRIQFANDRLTEAKDAITKQDIKDLYNIGVILIKPIRGRKKIQKRKTKKGPGKIKMKVNKRKQEYVKLTRKLRAYLKQLKNQSIINNESFLELRKKIRMKSFKSKAHLKEYLINTKKMNLDVKTEKPKKKFRPLPKSEIKIKEEKK